MTDNKTPSPETHLMGCESMVNPPNDNEKSIPQANICADRECDSRHGAGFHADIDRAAKRDPCNLLPGSERILDSSMRADARSAPDVLLGGHDRGPSDLHVPYNPFVDRQAVTASPEPNVDGAELLATVKEFARWHHLNELTIYTGGKPSDSEIDFEVNAWNTIKRALATTEGSI